MDTSHKSPGLQKQEAFLYRLDSTLIHCPSCKGSHTVIEITENYDVNKSGSGKCPVTGEGIKRDFTLFGGEQVFNIINNK